ncbi:MAG: hypothetical protein ACOY5Y_07525 [Pseudomonadota bacterium]
MARQHATPILVPADGPASALVVVSQAGAGGVLEDFIQVLVHEHPSVLPVAEIDPIFKGAVAVCRELETPAGPIDNFLVTPSGLPVLVECKLWRNAEARREVVGQILDYAKELARFTVSDLQREVGKRTGRGPSALLDIVRAADPAVDEVEFNDNLTANLRRGRFLLLLVGDGIRERVEAIAEYLQAHAGLHFSLGLVELPIYELPDGGRIVAPRVLAHTHVITRTVVALPDGHMVQDEDSREAEAEADPEAAALGDSRQAFWREFLDHLRLDDPEQPIPRAPRTGFVTFTLPAPGGSSWITVYREARNNEVGLFLSSHRDSAGEFAKHVIVEDWDAVRPALGGTVQLVEKYGHPRILDSRRFGSLDDPAHRAAAFDWLRERTNTFINVLRPRVRSAAADYAAQ